MTNAPPYASVLAIPILLSSREAARVTRPTNQREDDLEG